MARTRTAELRKWALMAQDLTSSEDELKEKMSVRRKEVLKDKRLMLMEALLCFFTSHVKNRPAIARSFLVNK